MYKELASLLISFGLGLCLWGINPALAVPVSGSYFLITLFLSAILDELRALNGKDK